jgi:hypothetical protein
MPHATVPILLSGYLDREALDHAWQEIERTMAVAPDDIEVLFVIASWDGELSPTLEFIRKLAAPRVRTATKIYWAAKAGALIALRTQRRQIVRAGTFCMGIGSVDIEFSELDESRAHCTDGRSGPPVDF